MKLYLMRHGEAYDAQVQIQRPLTEKGRDEVQRVANMLVKNNINIADIFHSGVLRAQQTAEIVAQTLNFQRKLQIMPQLNKPDDVDIIVDKISGFVDDTLLVGHIPVMPLLVSELVTNTKDQEIVIFEPASLVCLEKIEENWGIGWVIKPSLN